MLNVKSLSKVSLINIFINCMGICFMKEIILVVFLRTIYTLGNCKVNSLLWAIHEITFIVLFKY